MLQLKWVVAAGLLIGVAAGGAWSRVSPAEGSRPQARPDPIRLAEVVDDSQKPKNAFEKAYSLADGEDLKMLFGPAIEARNEHYKGKGREIGFGIDPGDVQVAGCVVFYWRDGKRRWAMTMAGGHTGDELRSMLFPILGIREQEIEGDRVLIGTQIPADLLIRDDVPPDKLISQLEVILRRDFVVPIRLSLRTEPRDAIVVRGRYEYKPVPERKPAFDAVSSEDDRLVIYSRELGDPADNGRSRVVSGADFPNLLSELGLFIGRRVVDEVESRPKRRLDWQIVDCNIEKANDPEDRRELVLKHLVEQTGLTFREERRAVRVLHVERTE